MRVLILIQLLAGFVLAFLGVIIMFHLYEVWLGLGITLVGFYAVIRAVHHSSYENGMERGRELYDEQYHQDEDEEETRRLIEEGKIESFTKEELDKDPGKLFRRK